MTSNTPKIPFGLIGLNFGRQILERTEHGDGSPYFELAGVCDTNRERCDEVADQYGVPAYTDVDELLADDRIEMVVVMTGPNGRASLLEKIIRSGRDVMTTKPFEQDPEAAASVLKEARELGRFIWLNSPAPVLNRDFRIIHEWEERYNLGRLVAGHNECWYKSIEEADGSWYDDPDQCPAAPILRLGIYGINDLLHFFGDPVEVQLMETRLFTGRPTPDLARLSIKFRDGAIVDTLDGWTCQPGRSSLSMTLYYENGTVFRNPALLPNEQFNQGSDITLCVVTAEDTDGMPRESIRIPKEETSMFYAWEAFHHALTTRERPQDETPDSVIVNSIRILEAAARASKNGGMATL